MPYEFGDVVLAPFPFFNQAASKKRPAVVVSSVEYIHARPDVIAMAIPSQLRPGPGLAKCGLPVGRKRAWSTLRRQAGMLLWSKRWSFGGLGAYGPRRRQTRVPGLSSSVFIGVHLCFQPA